MIFPGFLPNLMQKKYPRKTRSIFLLTCLVCFNLCVPYHVLADYQDGPRNIRVRILRHLNSVKITLDSRYKIYTLKDNKLIKEGKSLYRAKVAAASGGLKIGKSLLNHEGIKIKTKKDGAIYIDKWRFRGEIGIFKDKNSKLVFVNYLDIEDYLYGVLRHEVSHRWPYEVLKAQAIAARTYALYQKEVMKDKAYDLTSDIYSQVYGGRRSEGYRTNKAVNFTKGKVLTYKGDIFPAYYHATCGGKTEDANNLWKTNLAPLKGVECKFCKRSKHFHWTRKIKLHDIEKANLKLKGITSIKIESKNKAGRINDLIITHNAGVARIPGKDFRIAIGPNLLKSNNYEVAILGANAIFKGIGWGHGVGMCQWGAYYMAKNKYKAEEILQHYYPGTEIKTR